MKVSTKREDLAGALNKVIKVVPSKAVMPIVEYFHFSFTANQITVRGTSLDMDIVATIPCKSKEEGQFCIPGKIITDIVRSLRDDTINLSIKEKKVEMKSSSGKYTFSTIDPKEYISLRQKSSENTVVASAQLLGKSLRIASMFVNEKDQMRPATTGVNIRIRETHLCIEGGSGASLSQCSFPFITGSKWDPSIVPIPFVRLVVDIFQTGEVVMSANTNTIFAEGDGVAVIATLIAASYPDVDGLVFSKTAKTKRRFHRSHMEEATRRVKHFMNPQSTAVALYFGEPCRMVADGDEHQGEEFVDSEGDGPKIESALPHNELSRIASSSEEEMYMDMWYEEGNNKYVITIPDSKVNERHCVMALIPTATPTV